MKSILKICLLLICPFSLLAVNIAITIDDFPLDDGPFFTVEERTDALIKACDLHSCKAAFFCIGINCLKNQREHLLLKLDKKGHFLCNHSMNHLHLSAQKLDDFKEEILQVDGILAPYQNMRKWYRYPFLDYGERVQSGGDRFKALQSIAILKEMGYSEGYVTINTFDWHIDTKLSQAKKNGYTIHYESLKDLYLKLVKSWCQYYIDFYAKLFPEEFTHTLLFHANDLNALFLQDILEMIKQSGWNIVSPESAFTNTHWRKSIFDNLEIITHKPPTLSCDEIDFLLEKEKVFVK